MIRITPSAGTLALVLLAAGALAPLHVAAQGDGSGGGGGQGGQTGGSQGQTQGPIDAQSTPAGRIGSRAITSGVPSAGTGATEQGETDAAVPSAGATPGRPGGVAGAGTGATEQGRTDAALPSATATPSGPGGFPTTGTQGSGAAPSGTSGGGQRN